MKNSQEILEQIASKKKLTVLNTDNRQQFPGRSIVANVEDRDGLESILRVLVSTRKYDLKSFLTENNFLELAQLSSLREYIPLLYEINVDSYPYWSLRERVHGESASHYNLSLGYKMSLLDLVAPTQMIEIQSELQAFGMNNEPKKLFPIVKNDHLFDYVGYSLYRFKHEAGLDISDKEILKLKFKRFELPMFYVLQHNDLYPDNFILDENLFKIIDWERAGYDFPLKEHGFIYTMAWRDRRWQEEYKALSHDYSERIATELIHQPLSHMTKQYFNSQVLYWSCFFYDLVTREEKKGSYNIFLNTDPAMIEEYSEYLRDTIQEVIKTI